MHFSEGQVSSLLISPCDCNNKRLAMVRFLHTGCILAYPAHVDLTRLVHVKYNFFVLMHENGFRSWFFTL